MNDFRKSALWALISIPMSFVVIFLNWVFERGDILAFTLLPSYLAVVAYAALGGMWGREWWMVSVFVAVSFVVQYLGYFLFIYLSLKFFRVLTISGDQYVTKEGPETDPRFPPLWLIPLIPTLIGTSLLDSYDSFKGSTEWLLRIVAFISQYLGYFLLIYFMRKFIQTKAENLTK